MKKNKIAILGVGNLGFSIAKGLIKNSGFESLFLTKRNPNEIEAFSKEKNVTVTDDNTKAITDSELIILAVQPRHLHALLEQIKPSLSDKHILVSTAAGVKISEIEKVITDKYSIVRAMPNTAISVGKSMTCICSNEKGKPDIPLVLEVFNKLGTSMCIPEEQMQAATVICASGIAFWMRLVRATTQGAIQLGFESDEALQISVQTCLGAASLLTATGNHPEQEIDRVTTPGGCTIEGLNEMEHRGLSSSLIKGLVASYEKIHQITK